MEQYKSSDKKVNGVHLPENVVRELERLGRALDSFSSGELQSAVIACHMDGRLIDDPHGDNFLDMLELTEEEKLQQQKHKKEEEIAHEEEQHSVSAKIEQSRKITSFCKRLLESREKRHNEEHELSPLLV